MKQSRQSILLCLAFVLLCLAPAMSVSATRVFSLIFLSDAGGDIGTSTKAARVTYTRKLNCGASGTMVNCTSPLAFGYPIGATLSTANLTLTAANVGIINGYGISGNRTVAIDSPANVGAGRGYQFYDFGGNTSSALTVVFSVTGGGSTLNGGTTFTVGNATYDGCEIISNGTVFLCKYFQKGHS